MEGKSVRNIDYVLVSYDNNGLITNFGSLEVQAVYISGNVRNVFRAFMSQKKIDPLQEIFFDNSPRPDYLSSSRKRLAPQLLYKGGILRAWGKRQVVALQSAFFETLPDLPIVSPEEAEIAWMLYDLELSSTTDRLNLVKSRTVYTKFEPALLKMTVPNPGELGGFISQLQGKLDKELRPLQAGRKTQ